MGAARLSAASSQVLGASVPLAAAATTSAGIFDAQGRLVRTLWRGRVLPAGPVTMEWDGLDDDGAPLPHEERYEARLLSHHIQYEWQGVIGNTSRVAPGQLPHRSYLPICDMAIDALGNAFYVVGYNEQQSALHRFDARHPERPASLGHADFRRIFRYVATDGELAYFANVGLVAPHDSPFRGADTFVVAMRVADGGEHVFAAGKRRDANFQWESGIDYEVQQVESRGEFPDAPSGLAVQRRGRLLFVCHRGSNQVRLFDKKDGRLVGSVDVESPADVDVAPDDSFWVICRIAGRAAVARFREQQGTWRLERRIDDADIEPVAIGVSPLDGTLALADARSQQIRAYDDSGQALWVFGQRGGYREGGPEVTPARFSFSAGAAYIAFQADGSFWVGDPLNERNLQFSPQRRYSGQIQYLSHSYVSTVDGTRPGRVFSGFLEFEVDYRKPLPDSWRLVRNWSVGLDTRYLPKDFNGIRAAVTLDDGRTLATLFRSDGDGDELVELGPAGVRTLGMRLREDERLYPDGTLRSHLIRFGGLHVYQRRIESFETGGVPHWSEPVVLAETTGLEDRDPYYHDVPVIHGVNDPGYPRTGTGAVISFNPGTSRGFHLGALRPGTDGWLWRASPSGEWQLDQKGRVLTRDGTFELGRGVNYPASVAVASGASIVYGYHGEAWNGGQANQWMHFHESGLFLGQFGESPYPAENAVSAQPGAAGNSFCPSLVAVGGELFLWHNDESVHGGIHRWRIRGMSDVHIAAAPISPRGGPGRAP
ncbi:MAG TPA: FlgD immunoglobulin-like domain containing protein [Steroidobacteraceae bacterium]|nr:FlgD immunoglobulin-like domain containing protein [Steroidobacteraceae bacterium]